ncbi:putative prenyltransferase [Thermoascus aurantiacus ATCC 26904]
MAATSMHLSRLRKWFLSSPPVEFAIAQLRELLIGALKQGPIPQHVAFVMDGNRRFARSRRIETVEGHNLGFEALARILEVCYKSGVKVVTIYAFSIENFKRSKFEVDALMDIAKVKLSQLAQHGDLLDRYGASVRVLGRKELLKPDVIAAVDRAVELTSRNGDRILNICFPYTSRDEITTAIRDTVIDYSRPLEPPRASPTAPRTPFSESHIAHNIRAQALNAKAQEQNSDSESASSSSSQEDDDSAPNDRPRDTIYESSSSFSSSTTLHIVPGQDTKGSDQDHLVFISPETITPQTLTDHMFTKGNPPLDLLIRTSGVERLSDFMLWQCHQDTEIVFLDVLWPEFDLWHFLPVLWRWQRRITKSRKGSGDVDEDIDSDIDSYEDDVDVAMLRKGAKIKGL